MGLCAFRNENYDDTEKYLKPICQQGTLKLKDYLSQAYNKDSEKMQVFDKEDKKRTIPFIMMLTVDEIDCVYNIVVMTLDLPKILQMRLGKTIPCNHNFLKNLCSYERQVLFSLN